jgi:hypothetical protein
MYEWTAGWMDGWMDGCMDDWLDGLTYGLMDGRWIVELVHEWIAGGMNA